MWPTIFTAILTLGSTHISLVILWRSIPVAGSAFSKRTKCTAHRSDAYSVIGGIVPLSLAKLLLRVYY